MPGAPAARPRQKRRYVRSLVALPEPRDWAFAVDRAFAQCFRMGSWPPHRGQPHRFGNWRVRPWLARTPGELSGEDVPDSPGDQPVAKSCSGLVPAPGVPGRDSVTSRRPSELCDTPARPPVVSAFAVYSTFSSRFISSSFTFAPLPSSSASERGAKLGHENSLTRKCPDSRVAAPSAVPLSEVQWPALCPPSTWRVSPVTKVADSR